MSAEIDIEEAERIAERFVMKRFNADEPRTLSVELQEIGSLPMYLVELEDACQKYLVQVSATNGSIKGYRQIDETDDETDDEPYDEPDDEAPTMSNKASTFAFYGSGNLPYVKQEDDSELGKLARDIATEGLRDIKEEMDKQKRRKEIRKRFFIGE